MTGSELGLVGIIAICLAFYNVAFRQQLRCLVCVLVLGCLWGAMVQPLLGPEMNRYNTNVSLYVSYVSVAVVLIWGIGLASVYSAHLLLARLLGARSRFRHFAAVSVPVVMALEVVGSDVIHVKLFDYAKYQSLMPGFNAMNAPAWLYLFYLVTGALFYLVVLAFRLDAGDWKASMFGGARTKRTMSPRAAFAALVSWRSDDVA